jgi:hypothetical protein
VKRHMRRSGLAATVTIWLDLLRAVSSLKCSTGPLANKTSYGLPLARKDVN